MAVVYRCVGILTIDVVVFFRSPGVFHSHDSFPLTFHRRLCETSSGVVAIGVITAEARRAGDKTSKGRNPENGRSRNFGRRQQHRQSGFQHTNRPRPSSPELFNKDHNASHESLSHLNVIDHSIIVRFFSYNTEFS